MKSSEPISLPLPARWPRRLKTALLYAIGLERTALLEVRAGFENSPDPRAALLAEVDRLRELVEIKDEVNRLLRARIETITAAKRPHYSPEDRQAIVELRARTGWTLAQTARELVLAAQTVANWMRRIDEQGPDALLQTPTPVNKFPDFVTTLVQKLRAAAPHLGRRKVAEVFARMGLSLSASTAERMRKRPPPVTTPPPEPTGIEPEAKAKAKGKAKPSADKPRQVVTASHPGHVFHVDMTQIATSLGWWVPWFPFCLLPLWPFCWHIALVLDHYSRALVAFAVFKKEPTAAEIGAVLDRAVNAFGHAPRYIISDKGAQFQGEYRKWCERSAVKPRFGAVGKKGSIAVLERAILTLKLACLWRILVPLSLPRIEAEIAAYANWYNQHRPHAAVSGATPAEMRDGCLPACGLARIETRARMPLARGDPDGAAPPLRRRAHGQLELVVSYVEGRNHLPVFELREAA
jgi:transposase InsO family protein